MKNGLKALKDKAKKIWTSDGCTLAPSFNFAQCCIKHDWDYADHWRTSEKKRAEIDRDFRLCIKEHGWPRLCWVYWAAVRLFGWVPFWVFKRRRRLGQKEN